jgi:hypothetical protein
MPARKRGRRVRLRMPYRTPDGSRSRRSDVRDRPPVPAGSDRSGDGGQRISGTDNPALHIPIRADLVASA